MIKNDTEYILQWSKKLRCIEILGGVCEICKETDINTLEFHHKKGKKDKEGIISKLINGRWSNIELELNKCQLLCKNCHMEYHYNERLNNRKIDKYENNKRLFIEFKGYTGCKYCGYDKCIGSLNFHHRDPKEKEFIISSSYKTFNNLGDLSYELQKEIDKCDLICSNCHKKEHIDLIRFNKYKKEIYERIKKYKELPPKYDRDLILKLKEEGLHNVDIAKKLGCRKSTVTYALKTSKYYREKKKYDRNYILGLKNKGLGTVEISRQVGCHRDTINQILKDLENGAS